MTDPIASAPPADLSAAGAGTASKVTVAIVDSGVDGSHPCFANASLRHAIVAQQGKKYTVVPDQKGGDASGHGTACAGIVHRMMPEAQLVSVRALGPDGRGSRQGLLAALAYCIREKFDVVNLSLGIDVPRRAPLKVTDHRPILSLYELADRAYWRGVVLVASGPNAQHFRTYPGRAKSLIGVGRADFKDEERIEVACNDDHDVVAPGTDVLAPAAGGGERRFTGTSFACPFVAAHCARIRSRHPLLPVDLVRAQLHRQAAEALAS